MLFKLINLLKIFFNKKINYSSMLIVVEEKDYNKLELIYLIFSKNLSKHNQYFNPDYEKFNKIYKCKKIYIRCDVTFFNVSTSQKSFYNKFVKVTPEYFLKNF